MHAVGFVDEAVAQKDSVMREMTMSVDQGDQRPTGTYAVSTDGAAEPQTNGTANGTTNGTTNGTND